MKTIKKNLTISISHFLLALPHECEVLDDRLGQIFQSTQFDLKVKIIRSVLENFSQLNDFCAALEALSFENGAEERDTKSSLLLFPWLR